MIGDTVKLDLIDKRRVLALVDRAREVYADYDKYAAEEKALGLTPHYCVHGRSRWTDADIWCGECEDGYDRFDYLTELAVALGQVKRARAKVNDRARILQDALTADPDMPFFAEMFKWAIEPVEGLVNIDA